MYNHESCPTERFPRRVHTGSANIAIGPWITRTNMCRRHRLLNPKAFPVDRIPEWTHHRRSREKIQHLLPKVPRVGAVGAPEKAGNGSGLTLIKRLYVSRYRGIAGASKPVLQ